MTKVLSATGKLAVLLLFAGIPLLPGQAEAWPPGPTQRSNHVPNVGRLAVGEQPLGDMWTFYCPPGGRVEARVDTKDDTDLGTSSLDPILELLDANGVEIAQADDNVTCTYAPLCGFQCPRIRSLCGDTWDLHSLIVRDFGTAGTLCNDGGGYELTVDVYDENGNQLSPDEVQLGGGPSRGVPGWAVEEGKAPVGPALDDENVPRRSPPEEKLPLVGPVTPPVLPPLPPLP
jgi:hypothetical protein